LPAKGQERVLLGIVGGVHGVRGLVRVRSFTADPLDLGAYGPLVDDAGRQVALTVMRPAAGATGVVIARVEGVGDRAGAMALKGMRLHVDRDALPAPAGDEFYCADLVGLTAAHADGGFAGKVAGVLNFGGGDVLEIETPEGTSVLIPFTKAAVPVVDLAHGRLVVAPPAEVEARPDPSLPP
jgi:16S rRNA processing protein RimM